MAPGCDFWQHMMPEENWICRVAFADLHGLTSAAKARAVESINRRLFILGQIESSIVFIWLWFFAFWRQSLSYNQNIRCLESQLFLASGFRIISSRLIRSDIV